MDNNPIVAYMCKTDYEYHVPYDMHGCRIFFSVEDLERDRPCVSACGIVEVEINFVRVLREEKDEDDEDHSVLQIAPGDF